MLTAFPALLAGNEPGVVIDVDDIESISLLSLSCRCADSIKQQMMSLTDMNFAGFRRLSAPGLFSLFANKVPLLACHSASQLHSPLL